MDLSQSTTLNVERKIASLFRRKVPFFSMTYSWSSKQLVILDNQEQYFQSIMRLRNSGYAKRSEVYLDRFVEIASEQHCIYLVSYGDIRSKKMVYGENPLAMSLGVCMFDYVYVFVESKQLASRKIQIRMRELAKMEKWFEYGILKKTGQNLFGGTQKQNASTTQISRFLLDAKDNKMQVMQQEPQS